MKSRLWEFHQSDKQSGCVHYYMEGGKRDLFRPVIKPVWDCLGHYGWKATVVNLRLAGCHAQQWWTILPCEVESLHIEGQVCLKKTGLFWTESWMGLSNRLVLAWEGQWLGWMIPSCSKSSQTNIWFAMDKRGNVD